MEYFRKVNFKRDVRRHEYSEYVNREFYLHSSNYLFQVISIHSPVFGTVGRLNRLVEFCASSCFYTVDQSGCDYQVISSMHIDRLIVGV